MVTLWYLWYVEVLGYFFFWLEKSYRWNLICLANVYSIWWLGPLDVHYLSVTSESSRPVCLWRLLRHCYHCSCYHCHYGGIAWTFYHFTSKTMMVHFEIFSSELTEKKIYCNWPVARLRSYFWNVTIKILGLEKWLNCKPPINSTTLYWNDSLKRY